ncbi:tRNA-U20-dihydrouridine synthase [Desulfuromusa kysingii]|uniref:tRNA-dihydrouridine synthase n=1 Tax=Desulfuromusa kysingii TaxID=37625 RepID=A0A1H3Y304_9BACT|nr:tRNA dihydrouridine synthase DusB [Desulfuromusa kysingii]SEA06105.1 tRNA-U20-dihydrouridine synthase [Desulfuromusa kysingii]
MHTQPIQIKSLQLVNPVILAPMAGITNLPYRRVMKSFGASLVFSEMISANGLIRDGKKTRLLLTSHKDEFPLGVQLFGEDPMVLSKAAESIKDETTLLDLNMGCPVKKVVRNGAGSALLQEPLRVAQIVAAVRKVYPGPLTIKIRSGWDEQSLNFLEIGRIAEAEGVDAITLHPRPRSQGFSGSARWEHITALKSELNIPVFGSGDIFNPEDGIAMLRKTGCDAIMIGRGGYGNPWLIRQIIEQLAGKPVTIPTPLEKYQTALQHLQLHHDQFGEKKAILEMRKHLCWYTRSMEGAALFRASLQKTEQLDHIRELVRIFFSQAEAA